MAIKKYKPVTPGQRNKAISSFESPSSSMRMA